MSPPAPIGAPPMVADDGDGDIEHCRKVECTVCGLCGFQKSNVLECCSRE